MSSENSSRRTSMRTKGPMMHLGSIGQGKSSSFNPASFFESNLNALGANRQLASQRSNVIMSATTKEDAPTVTGEIDITPKEGHLDMIFYDQEFDSWRDIPHYHGNEFKSELMKNAKLIATPGKGILAADESTGTIGKRFD